MNQTDLNNLIPQDFADNSRVWIFQSNRPFGEQEEKEINEQLYHFYAQWKAHGKDVKGWGKLLFKWFIVIIADEDAAEPVSGCSTDDMMRVIKSLERQYQVNLFDRLSLTFLVKDKVEILPMLQVQYALDKGYITDDTLLFNNLVATKSELLSNWMQPLKESWLASKVEL